jgi:two-component system cell cycle response regulator
MEIPVVVITGQGDELIASRIIQAGAYDYLPKAKVSGKACCASSPMPWKRPV